MGRPRRDGSANYAAVANRTAKNAETQTTKAVTPGKFNVVPVDDLISQYFGSGMPEEVKDAIRRNTPGYNFGNGLKFAKQAEFVESLESFREDTFSVEEENTTEGDVKNCSACDAVRNAKAEAAAAQKNKEAAVAELEKFKEQNSARFNVLSDQLNDKNREISVLKSENATLAEKAQSALNWEEEKKACDELLDDAARKLKEAEAEAENLREQANQAVDAKYNAEKLKQKLSRTEKMLKDEQDARKNADAEANRYKGENINLKTEMKALKTAATGGDSSSKRQLKDEKKALEKTISDLQRKLQETEDSKQHAIDELVGFKASYEKKNIDDLNADLTLYKGEYEEAAKNINELNKTINDLKASLDTARSELATEKNKTASLQSSLNSKKAAGGKGILDDKGDLFYPEEMADLFRTLAERNIMRLEDAKDTYKREYDLCAKVVKEIKDSGWQDRMRARIDAAAASDNQLIAFKRLGFEDADGSKHDKLCYHGDPRYTMILAVTPSDVRGFHRSASDQKAMLCIAPAKDTTDKE